MDSLKPAGDAVFGLAMWLPVMTSAQAVISGVVRDASGAVLPGVTVEAASPALIEKTRTAVTGNFVMTDDLAVGPPPEVGRRTTAAWRAIRRVSFRLADDTSPPHRKDFAVPQ